MITHITLMMLDGESDELLSDEPELAHLRPGDRVDVATIPFMVDRKSWTIARMPANDAWAVGDVALFITLHQLPLRDEVTR